MLFILITHPSLFYLFIVLFSILIAFNLYFAISRAILSFSCHFYPSITLEFISIFFLLNFLIP